MILLARVVDAVFYLALFVIFPAIAVLIGCAAWLGKPKT
jgi:hypothetical protein